MMTMENNLDYTKEELANTDYIDKLTICAKFIRKGKFFTEPEDEAFACTKVLNSQKSGEKFSDTLQRLHLI
jgi:hypothetical protein